MLRGFSVVLFLMLFVAAGCLAQTDSSAFSGDYDESDNKILYRKEWSISGIAHSGGFGLGYRNGKHITGYKKRMLEFEFVGMKHPKEIKSINTTDENSKSFIYGKLNSLFILRSGIGIQKVLNNKPIWGGIEVRYFYYGGAAIGIAKPVYLYIRNIEPVSGQSFYTIERYDPAKHVASDIVGRAPFSKGFDKLSLYPGIYLKTGFNFEYGAEDVSLRVLEAGVSLDVYPKQVKIMAFDNGDNYFLNFYLSFNFGKRKY